MEMKTVGVSLMKLNLTLPIPEARELQDKIVKLHVALRKDSTVYAGDCDSLARLRGKVSTELFYSCDSPTQEVTLGLNEEELSTLERFLDFQLEHEPNEKLNKVNALLWDTKLFIRRSR